MNNQPNNGSNAQMPRRAPESASRPYNQPQSMPNPQFRGQAPHPVQHAGAGRPGAPVVAGGPAGPNGPTGNNPGGPDRPEGDKKKRPVMIGIAIVLVVAIASAIFSAWWFLGGGSNFYDSQAVSGQAPYKTQEEIVAELNRIVEEGMLNISIASLIEFENGESEGTAYIENVPSNRYVLRVTIKLDSTGEEVYQSGGLRPDSYIEKIKLSKDLPAGTYPATATFVAYDPDNLEEVGQASARITLQVNS